MPDWKQEIRIRLAGVQLDPTQETAILDEFADHLDDRYEELRASGASEHEAVQGALSELSLTAYSAPMSLTFLNGKIA